MPDPLGMGDGERNGVRPRCVVTDEYCLLDVQLVEQRLERGTMVLQGESPELAALGSAVAAPVESDRPSRAQQRQQPIVDAVVVGEAVHQDDRRIVAWDLAHEHSSRRRLHETIMRCQHGVSHGSVSFFFFVFFN